MGRNAWVGWVTGEPNWFVTYPTRESRWVTKAGGLVKVKDMGDRHLLNLLRVLERQSPIKTTFKFRNQHVRARWVTILAREAVDRGLLKEAEEPLVAALVADRLRQ